MPAARDRLTLWPGTPRGAPGSGAVPRRPELLRHLVARRGRVETHPDGHGGSRSVLGPGAPRPMRGFRCWRVVAAGADAGALSQAADMMRKRYERVRRLRVEQPGRWVRLASISRIISDRPSLVS